MKRKMMGAAILLAPLALAAQHPKGFSINGTIGNLNAPAKVYFDYMSNGKSASDSAILVNGRFTFTGQSSPYSYVRMGLSHDGTGKDRAVYGGDVIYFYMGNEKITIQSKDSLSNAGISGSAVNKEYDSYNRFIGGTIMEVTKAANKAFSAGTPEQQKDSLFFKGIDASFRQNVANRATKQIEFASRYPHSYFSVVALSEAGGTKGVAAIEPAFAKLDTALKQTDMGQELVQRIKAAHTIKEGLMAPGFTLNDTEGHPVSLEKMRGKYLLVEFWASWCSPCRAENPNLRAQYEKYHSKGFEVLGVSLDDNKAKWTQAITADNLPWIHVSDLKGWNNEAARLYGVRAVPASYLLDPTGKIIGTNLRGESLNAKLASIWP